MGKTAVDGAAPGDRDRDRRKRVALAGASGCAALTNPVADGIPVSRLPDEVLGESREALRPIPLNLLGQDSPDVYRLAAGDILGMVIEGVLGDQIPADPGRDGLLLGLLSLDSDKDGVQAFALTLHTDLSEVFVRRLAAGHRIGVSMWSILSQLPLWLALWVVWVSLIVVANYHAARLSGMQRSQNAPHTT